MPRRILIVEDVDTAATTLEIALLNIPNVEVVRVEHGVRALEYLAANSVDVVITDLDMPFMDGLELIRRVRGEQRFISLPIVVVSARNDPQASQDALRLGANAFFAKPWSPRAVREKVETLLNHSCMRQL